MPRRRSERSEIVHIVVTGYQKKISPRKHYVFVIDVTWNNHDRFEVFRRYSEFFSFQTMLKAMFPNQAGRRTEERSIPALPKRIFVGRSHVARVAEARVEQINRYCQNIISLEPSVSESAHVIGFFSPRIGDIQLPRLHLQRPASLYPQHIPAGSLFEEYAALAEFEAEDDSQISFKSGDQVLVMSKDDSGWWLCQVGERTGWAPPSYLKKCATDESDSEEDFLGLPESYKDSTVSENGKDSLSDDSGLESPSRPPGVSSRLGSGFKIRQIEVAEYKALEEYKAQGPGQVTFAEGDSVHVLDKMEDGWWFVSNGREEGWAPCSYLENLSGAEEEDDVISSLDVSRYVTLDDYTAEERDELSFPKGVYVEILQKSLDGWWRIRWEGRTGLAPATFLKKVEADSHEHSPQTATQDAKLKESPPISPVQPPSSFLPVNKFRQPPRKESVRIRASIRKLNKIEVGKSAAAGNKTIINAMKAVASSNRATTEASAAKLSPLLTQGFVPIITERDSEEEDEGQHAYENADSWTQGGVSSRPKPHLLTSPGSSDSEDQTQGQRSPRAKRLIHRFEQRSGSESSGFSEEGSPSTKSKKPQALPRNSSGGKLPQMTVSMPRDNEAPLPRPSVTVPSKPSGGPSTRPKSPRPNGAASSRPKSPRPNGAASSRPKSPRPNGAASSRPKSPQTRPDEATSSRQKSPRPDGAEFLSPTPNGVGSSPKTQRSHSLQMSGIDLTRPDPVGAREMVKSHSLDELERDLGNGRTPPILFTPPRPRASEIRRARLKSPEGRSAFQPILQCRSPSPSPSRSLREEDEEYSSTSLPSSPNLRPPVNQARRSSSPAPPPPPKTQLRERRESEPENPFSQQMAETMIKYILASGDSSLRSALRDIITSDPEAMSKINSA